MRLNSQQQANINKWYLITNRFLVLRYRRRDRRYGRQIHAKVEIGQRVKWEGDESRSVEQSHMDNKGIRIRDGRPNH
ncbi:hypothetical protein HanIR_Chr15g0732401 [Helianthus annuus]|nr:hypothetical protein HanIR_Chr15g0732401 [Helianthus annuus]